ncbi:hypothetical protein Tco_1156289 [Tanacetum coccineum]
MKKSSTSDSEGMKNTPWCRKRIQENILKDRKIARPTPDERKSFQRSRSDKDGAWSDSSEDEEEKAEDETCLVAQASNELML